MMATGPERSAVRQAANETLCASRASSNSAIATRTEPAKLVRANRPAAPTASRPPVESNWKQAARPASSSPATSVNASSATSVTSIAARKRPVQAPTRSGTPATVEPMR